MIMKMQNIVPLSSAWTVKSMVDNIRSIVQEPTMANITDHDIRSYINLSVSNIYSMLGEKANDDYGIWLTAHYDTLAPIPNVNLTKPIANDAFAYMLNAASLGVAQVQPNYTTNPHTFPQVASSPTGIFGQHLSTSIDPVYADNTNMRFYTSYFVPYTIISRIINVGVALKTDGTELGIETDLVSLVNPISDTLRRASMSEIMYWHKKTVAIGVGDATTTLLSGDRGTGAWSYFGGLLYLYMGIDIAGKFISDAGTDPLTLRDIYDHDYMIYAVRSPLLDNLMPISDIKSGYYTHIDLSDANMRLLSLLVQKMSMEHLGKQISTDAEMLIRELTAKITQNTIDLPKIEAQERLKVDQGFQTR